MPFWDNILEFTEDAYLRLVFLYSSVIMSGYLIQIFLSAFGLKDYLKKNSFVNYEILLSSHSAPKLSLLAPAYNEGLTIEENVKSLLSLNYTNYQVILINDGSKDNSMEILIKKYDLVPIELTYESKIQTKPVKNIYKSRKTAFKKLIVVDKENGGKADSLNAGMNIAENPYIVCIDVDCVLDKDSLLKLAKPFLEDVNKKVIATGGVVRIANECTVVDGRLVDVSIPDKLFPRTQILEYLRAFLFARMAWKEVDGLLLISGAFGAFDKEIALKVGGYNHKTVGEDMELVVRMRRYMAEQKIPYSVAFIPDPLCWTEAPETKSIFIKQRSRWMRGTIETLWIHRKMMLNPKFKLLGMLSLPYWTLFEFLGPGIEFIGILFTIVLFLLGKIELFHFILLFIFVYAYALMFSVLALYAEEQTFHKYPNIKDYLKLLTAAIIEPFYFHQISAYAAILGYWEKITGKNSWGKMTRKGFQKEENKVTINPTETVTALSEVPAKMPKVFQS